MKNKHKLTIAILVIAIIAVGFNFRADISGFSVADINQPGISEEREVQHTLINSSMVPVKTDEDVWTIYQKYKVGENEECIKDCAFYASDNNLEFYKAYVQKWGTCMCKYYAE